MDIYLKLRKKVNICAVNQLLLEDVADIIATADVAAKLKKLKLRDIPPEQRASYLVSVADVVRNVKKSYPDASINSLGEMDTLVHYMPQTKAEPKALAWLKLAAVSAILFVGSATAIMSFHNDAEIPKVFGGMFKLIFGYENENPRLIEVPYSIGLAAGIIIFFNHAFGKKLTDDPTPVEVQLSLYEDDVADTLINIIESQEDKANA